MAAPVGMICSDQRSASGIPSMGSGAANGRRPPQQHHLDRCHEAEDDHPFQPCQPPLDCSLGRLRQQSGRVADDRHDHHRNHVPKVKSHNIAIGYRQHPLDEAGTQRAVERGRECYDQPGLRPCERQHRHGGRRRIAQRRPGTPIMLTGYSTSQISSASATTDPAASSTGLRPANSPPCQAIPSSGTASPNTARNSASPGRARGRRAGPASTTATPTASTVGTKRPQRRCAAIAIGVSDTTTRYTARNHRCIATAQPAYSSTEPATSRTSRTTTTTDTNAACRPPSDRGPEPIGAEARSGATCH